MWVRRRLRVTPVLALLVGLAAATPARAQPGGDLAQSNALFEEGKRLQAEGHVAEACDRFAESYRLAPRGGTLLNLGLCHEQQGKLLAARRELKDALATAERDGRSDRVPVATEHLAAVEAKLSSIAVTAPTNAPEAGLVVRVDDAPIDPHDWSAVPVEPGRHVVTVTASGFRTREVVVIVAEGAGQRLTVAVPPLEPIAAEPTHGPAAATPPGPVGGGRDTLRTTALVTGIAGVAISLAAGAWALGEKSVVHDHCAADKSCDSTGASAADLGRVLVGVGTAAFAVGAIGIGGYFLLPSSSSSPSAAPSARAVGLTLSGTF